MGAEFWEHLIRYEPEPEAALRRLQAEVFQAAPVDLDVLIEERIEDMADAVQSCESEDDYGLLDYYRDALDRLQRLATQGVPPTVNGRIRRLREIEAIGSDSVPGVLAIEGVAREPTESLAYCPDDRQVEAICGTPRPTAREAREGVERLHWLDRGMAICLPVYEGDRPISWYFAGSTAD